MKLLCVGDNVIDYYVNTGEMYPGGNAVNVAVHGAKLGVDSAYLGNLGDDRMSGVIRRALDRFQVAYDACVTIPGGTTKYCNYEVVDGERTYLNVELGENWSGPMELGEREQNYIQGFDLVHSSCNAKMEQEMWKLSRSSCIFVFDFGEKEKYRRPEYLEKVCPGLDLAMFSHDPMKEEEARSFCEAIHAMGARHVLVTMGGAGQYVYNGCEMLHGDVKKVDAVDTMGAGDAFLTAFILELYRAGWKKGRSMPETDLKAALLAGQDYSARNCMLEGGFGYKEA